MSEQLKEQTENLAADEQKSLLDEIVEITRLKPGDEGFSATKTGLKAFLKELVGTGSQPKVSPTLVDNMLADIDRQLSLQVNAIMHSAPFQEMERS